ncbi:TetR/AcrR family transcriptional regulator [Mycobacterium asiaticum]|uniref:TetR family transcriptional regulator n=1 Tax=Mycobacterium asiaticum TaxID=1790 RepID=A0A1A3BEX7_MYCAS|nr:TetR/AcrR family transcriptional regulator [Mycobacterium asiaticum]OBI72888.1 TetR family transcriptional regulator [Mycobacterium asiaticum]
MPQVASRGPGRPPAAKADETRKRIVRAARQVFSERGYDGATFQAIAMRADLTRPAINHYFASKRVLYAEVADRTNDLVLRAGMARARNETTLIARITAYITVAMEVDSQNPCTAAFLATAVLDSQRHPELRNDENDAVRMTREFLVWAVNDAVKSGELAPHVEVEALAEVLLLMLCGVGFYAGFVGSYQQVQSILDTLRQLIAGSLWTP